MKAHIVRSLALAIVGFAPVCASLPTCEAAPLATISSPKTLGAALEKAVTCNTDALGKFGGGGFDGSPDDPRPRLETVGVKIVNESGQDESGTITYRFLPA